MHLLRFITFTIFTAFHPPNVSLQSEPCMCEPINIWCSFYSPLPSTTHTHTHTHDSHGFFWVRWAGMGIGILFKILMYSHKHSEASNELTACSVYVCGKTLYPKYTGSTHCEHDHALHTEILQLKMCLLVLWYVKIFKLHRVIIMGASEYHHYPAYCM